MTARKDPIRMTPQEQQDLLMRVWGGLEDGRSVLRLGRLLADVEPARVALGGRA